MAGMESNTISLVAIRSNGSAEAHLAHETAVVGEPSTDQTKAVCDLAAGHAFYPDHNTPPVPVLASFGSGRLHQCRAEGSWDLERAMAEDAHRLIRSFRSLQLKDNSSKWEDLMFQFGPLAFLCADDRRIVGYAPTASEAEQQVTEFTKKYGIKPKPSGGSFQLIHIGHNDIGTVTVDLDATTVLNDEQLGVYYGDGFADWHRNFSGTLHETKSGLSILEGTPGTGKTSYLRHLMGALKQSHRFYFIPPSAMSVLSDPKFMEFWASQRRTHPDRKLAVILEDSDAALMTRAIDNSEQVSAILNLSDGMLGDFLRLQIICTINCTAADIDPALVRPGRLLCHRVFGRLDYAEARRLAEHLGTTLPAARDYSLAEVFAGHAGLEPTRPSIGFAA